MADPLPLSPEEVERDAQTVMAYIAGGTAAHAALGRLYAAALDAARAVPAGLDVERLARAIGVLSDSPLGFPTDDRIAARNLAREYAALAAKENDHE